MAAKTKTKIAQHVTLAEEKAAQVAEQTRPTKPISPSLLKKIQRVHEINELMAPYKAEIEEIRAAAFKEMDNKGVDVLTRKGVEVVSRDEVNQENLDKKELKAQFPEIAVQFIVTKVIYRINWKNRFTI
jgi:Holliday junction resolvasome RuvABC ATP-dependent DNA helicase subunit